MYFDPGTGSMIIQIVLAVVAMGGALWFAFRRKISKLFGKKKALRNASNDVDIDDAAEVIDVLEQDDKGGDNIAASDSISNNKE